MSAPRVAIVGATGAVGAELLAVLEQRGFALRELEVRSIPVNFLIPIEGNPVETDGSLTPERCLRALCLMRLINPSAEIRVAGGREGHLRSLEALDTGEALVWRAEFDDYAPVDGIPFAHALALEMVEGGTRAEISLRDVELNPELEPSIFRLRQPEVGEGGAGPGA